jgi:PAS domain S-box-containing protein
MPAASQPKPHPAVRYGAAVAASCLVLLVRKLLPLKPGVGLYPLGFAAVLVSAWYGGRGPGLVALAVFALGIDYFFVPPVHTFTLSSKEDTVALLLFVVIAALVAHFTAARRTAEEALTESEGRFRLAAENLPEVLWIEALDPRRVLYVSPSYERVWGHPPSELYAEPGLWMEAIHPEDRPTVSASFTRWLAGDGTYDAEYRIVRPDGAVRWIHDHGVLIRDRRGKPIRASGVAQDITERRQIEEQLRTSEEMWRAAFENNPTMYFMVDADGKILSVNPFGAQQLGYSVDELLGRSVLDVFHEGDRLSVQRNVAECIDRLGTAMQWELRKVRKDGTVIWVRESARAVRGPKQGTTVLVACEDITEAKRAEEALARARAELEHVTRVTTMGELAASIAHEVNQPLAAISTNANALLRWLAREPAEVDEAREAARRIVRDAARAGEIIERVRALARKSPSRKESLNVNDILRDVIALTRAEAAKSGVSVEAELATNVPRVIGDRVQLQQVTLNLIVNAIDAIGRTTDGPRHVVVRSARDGPNDVVVTVADSGEGVDPEATPHLFDAFFTTKPQGMGMGLAISRSIVESHGGRIWATENPPRGAAFHFALPASTNPS